MRVIITGGSGMVGKGVLLECLDSPQVEKVLSIGRSTTGIKHTKLVEIEHADFSNFTPIKDKLEGYHACYYCMGVSAAGLNEADYTRLTYNYALALAHTLHESNPEMTFIYVSGQGTDSTEKGRSLWARVKGKTENDLMAIGFRQSFMFRPGAIIPLRGITSSTKIYQFIYDYFMWLVKLIKFLSPNAVVNTTQIGQAMINIASSGFHKQIIAPKDIIVLNKHN